MYDNDSHSTPYGPVNNSFDGGYLNPLADSAFLPVGSQA